MSCAIIRQGAQYLTVQRSSSMREAGCWEFPGGKIEIGENAFDCLRREIDEELALQVKIHGFLRATYAQQGPMQIILLPFLCTIQSRKLELREHSAYSWLTWPELNLLTWCEADLGIVSDLNHESLEASAWWIN